MYYLIPSQSIYSSHSFFIINNTSIALQSLFKLQSYIKNNDTFIKSQQLSCQVLALLNLLLRLDHLHQFLLHLLFYHRPLHHRPARTSLTFWRSLQFLLQRLLLHLLLILELLLLPFLINAHLLQLLDRILLLLPHLPQVSQLHLNFPLQLF